IPSEIAELPQEMDLDVEIAMLVTRYYKLLLDELAVEKAELEEQIRQLRIENAQKQEQIYELIQEAEYWKTKCEIYSELLKDMERKNKKRKGLEKIRVKFFRGKV